MSSQAERDARIPEAAVLASVMTFLDSAGWKLEFDEGTRDVPRQPGPLLVSRAFIKADIVEGSMGDHYEAIVYLGPERVGNNWHPAAGILKLYFNLNGNFVTEDRFDRGVLYQ